MDQKKRHVVRYENMSEELTAAFNELYPNGFSDYFPDLVTYTKPDGTIFYAVTVEIPDAIYLVKIDVKTDDAEDIERWLEGDDDDQGGQSGATADTDSEGEALPDDNISQYGSDDDASE